MYSIVRHVGPALATLLAPAFLVAQAPAVTLEARLGAAVPTFDIADVAKSGLVFGAGLGVALGGNWHLMADADFGSHDNKTAGGPDIQVNHYMGKVGYDLVTDPASRWSAIVNLGAGAMTFKVDAPGGETLTYFAINAGAKISYEVSPTFALVLSPQGDIAFSDEAEVGGTTSWVWPFAVGAQVRF